MKKRIHISSSLLDNVYDYWLPSDFWPVVSRECTNIVIITLYYFCMYAQFFFQSAFVDFDYGLQPLHYLHDFLHECIYTQIYTNDMIHFLEEPYTVTQFYYIVNRVFSIFWYTLVYKLLLFFFFQRGEVN